MVNLSKNSYRDRRQETGYNGRYQRRYAQYPIPSVLRKVVRQRFLRRGSNVRNSWGHRRKIARCIRALQVSLWIDFWLTALTQFLPEEGYEVEDRGDGVAEQYDNVPNWAKVCLAKGDEVFCPEAVVEGNEAPSHPVLEAVWFLSLTRHDEMFFELPILDFAFGVRRAGEETSEELR